ncbi:MAG: hypothetical protein ACFCUH_02405 [Flavobacteriales bacterium]
MKKSLLIALAFFTAGISQAQFVQLEVEEVPNNGIVPGKTYRVYAKMQNPGDIVDAVFAEEKNPIEIKSTTKFYQHPKGGALSNEVQRFDIQNDPKLTFDSFFTIGLTDNYNNYVTPFLMDSLETKAFEQGNAYISYNSAWFVTPDKRQTQAGKDGRVLLMQLTTTGVVTGRLNLHGREKEVLDDNGDLVDGGFIIEQRGLTFTCGK